MPPVSDSSTRTISGELARLSAAQRMRVGALAGVHVAAVLCVVSVVGFLIFGHRLFEQLGTSWVSVVGAYLGGGLLGGVVWGALARRVRSTVTAYLVGAAVALPFAVLAVASVSTSMDPRAFIVVGAAFSLTVGGGVGVMAYRPRDGT